MGWQVLKGEALPDGAAGQRAVPGKFTGWFTGPRDKEEGVLC